MMSSFCNQCIDAEIKRQSAGNAVTVSDTEPIQPAPLSKRAQVIRVAILLCVLAAVFHFYLRNSSGMTWGGKPSVALGRKVLGQRIESQSKGAISLAGFTKTDGKEREVLGQKFYHMEYEAVISFSQDGSWLKGNPASSTPRFEFTPMRYGESGLSGFMGTLEGAVKVYPFQRETIKGQLVFERTERGWRSEEGITF